jgi:hypothetical protein
LPKANLRHRAAVGPVGKCVQTSMAFPAKRDQVDLGIVTKRTAPSNVVNIKIL